MEYDPIHHFQCEVVAKKRHLFRLMIWINPCHNIGIFDDHSIQAIH